MKAFTTLLTPDQARNAYARVFTPKPLGTEQVRLLDALHRVVAEDVNAGTDLPAFPRSTVDGYAVRATDTAGASSGAPVSLGLAGEVLMGENVSFGVGSGQAARIPTGGRLPSGADAVVMQEHAVRANGIVGVERAVTPGENIVARGADVRTGDVILHLGRRLGPADLGLLAALNRPEVLVFRCPHVGVIVTGDEVVAPGHPVRGSQIYDVNTYTLSALIEQAGGIAQQHGIVGDNLAVLADVARRAHAASDMLILAGGSSVGEKDLVADAVAALGAPGIVVHGISIRPGKPTILAVANGKPVFGLPGNVVSAMIIFDEFVRPVLQRLGGLHERLQPGRMLRAQLAGRIVTRDREDHVRVSLVERAGKWWATPLPGGSAIITSMVQAHGTVVVAPETTLAEGDDVEVRLLD